MGVGHDLVPSHRRERAARHPVGGTVVIVAEPDAADEVARVAHKPSIAVSVCGAGFARCPDPVEDRAFTGPILHNFVHHENHVSGDLGSDHLFWLLTVAVPAPYGGAVGHSDLEY